MAGDYLDVKVGDIVEAECFDAQDKGPRSVFMLIREGKVYPGQIYWGVPFPLGNREVTISVRKTYARLLYSPEEV